MQVPQFNELRNRLGGANAELRVVKNTLLRRALKDSNLPDLESYLSGQSAVVMGEADVSGAAKILKNFSAEFQKPKLKVGILDKAILDVAQIMALADLPSKDVLQAKLLGSAPGSGLDARAAHQHPGLASGPGAQGLRRQRWPGGGAIKIWSRFGGAGKGKNREVRLAPKPFGVNCPAGAGR